MNYSSYPSNSEIINNNTKNLPTPTPYEKHTNNSKYGSGVWAKGKEKFSTSTSSPTSVDNRISSNDIFIMPSTSDNIKDGVIENSSAKRYSCYDMLMTNNGKKSLIQENGTASNAIWMHCSENSKGQGKISCTDTSGSGITCCKNTDSKIMYSKDSTGEPQAYCTGTDADLVWVAGGNCTNKNPSQCIRRWKQAGDNTTTSWLHKTQCDAMNQCYVCNPNSQSNDNWIQPMVKASTTATTLRHPPAYLYPGKTYNNCEWLPNTYLDAPESSVSGYKNLGSDLTKGECSQHCISNGIQNTTDYVYNNNGKAITTQTEKVFTLTGPLCLSKTNTHTDTGACYYLPTGTHPIKVGGWASGHAISTCNGIYNSSPAAKAANCKVPDDLYTCPDTDGMNPGEAYGNPQTYLIDKNGSKEDPYNSKISTNTVNTKNCTWPDYKECTNAKTEICQNVIKSDASCGNYGYVGIDSLYDTCNLCPGGKNEVIDWFIGGIKCK